MSVDFYGMANHCSDQKPANIETIIKGADRFREYIEQGV